MKNQISIIGAGMTGSTTVTGWRRGNRDLVLVVSWEGMPQGKALDVDRKLCGDRQGRAGDGQQRLRRHGRSDIVVITSRPARKPGMSRDDLL